jgi:hypothetical protein
VNEVEGGAHAIERGPQRRAVEDVPVNHLH